MGSYLRMERLLSQPGVDACQRVLWITRKSVVLHCATHDDNQFVNFATEYCPN